jgi:hypothetical protein
MSLPNPLAAAMARVRNKNLHVWTAGYARWLARTTPARARAAFTPGGGPRHLLFALCDHYEPHWKNTDVGVGTERVRTWLHGYPALVGPYRDSDGLPPRHSFFFPGEEYQPAYLDALASLARRGLGEVELHLHHHDDTPDGLRAKIAAYLRLFDGHGHLTRTGTASSATRSSTATGASPTRAPTDAGAASTESCRCCSTPAVTRISPSRRRPIRRSRHRQPDLLARRRSGAPRAQDAGVTRARRRRPARSHPDDRGAARLRAAAGPLAVPRIENAALTADDPADAGAVRSWVARASTSRGARVGVRQGAHHGAPEKQAAALLGGAGDAARRADHPFQRRQAVAAALRDRARDVQHRHRGDGRKKRRPGAFRDHVLPPPPAAA